MPLIMSSLHEDDRAEKQNSCCLSCCVWLCRLCPSCAQTAGGQGSSASLDRARTRPALNWCVWAARHPQGQHHELFQCATYWSTSSTYLYAVCIFVCSTNLMFKHPALSGSPTDCRNYTCVASIQSASAMVYKNSPLIRDLLFQMQVRMLRCAQ